MQLANAFSATPPTLVTNIHIASMSQSERVNSVLAPYLALPNEHSQILITNVLGASANWLILQHLGALLGESRRDVLTEKPLENANADTSVILVSWLRDWEFWRTECRRSTVCGVDQ